MPWLHPTSNLSFLAHFLPHPTVYPIVLHYSTLYKCTLQEVVGRLSRFNSCWWVNHCTSSCRHRTGLVTANTAVNLAWGKCNSAHHSQVYRTRYSHCGNFCFIRSVLFGSSLIFSIISLCFIRSFLFSSSFSCNHIISCGFFLVNHFG